MGGVKSNIGGLNEKTNIDVVNVLCDTLDDLHMPAPGGEIVVTAN